MNKSESIGNLAAALSKLQGEIQNTTKDKAGYGYRYTTLDAILEMARPLLHKYELAITQLTVNDPMNPSVVGVEGVLLHSSGEWLSSVVYMPIEEKKGLSKAQGSGVIISYIRRYQIAALLGIAQTDNDAAIEKPKSNDELLAKVTSLIDDKSLHDSVKGWCNYYKVNAIDDLTNTQLTHLIKIIEERA